MSDDVSDPGIVARLNKIPPFNEDETDKPTDTEVETSKEEVVEETQVEDEVKDEPKEEITEDEALKNSKNPERTKKYIDKLKEEVKTEKKKNILESLITNPAPSEPQYPDSPITNRIPTPQQFPGLPQSVITEAFKGLVDDNGYVDSGLLISTLKDQQERTRLAEERAKMAEQNTQKIGKQFDDFQRNQIMREVHIQYPTLDPENEDFDESLWKYVRNEVVDQWMNGKPTDVMAAAKEGMTVLHGNDMKKVDKVKLEQAETAKKNINALGTSQTSQRESYADHDALVKATQLGKKGALAERLRKAGL